MEHWKEVKGYESLYEVSSIGRVRGIKRRAALALFADKNGRMQVTLSKDGKLKRHQVHTLMLLAFVSDKPFPEAVCRHLNGDHTINELWNLAWGTQSENMSDRVAHGRAKLGIAHQSNKLSEKQVRAIRADWANRMDQRTIAEKYQVSQPTIHSIIRGKTWKHLK